MHKPESFLENLMHKIFWDLEIQVDHPVPPKRPNLEVINKKITCYLVDFAVLEDYEVKRIQREKMDKYLYLAKGLKKAVEHIGDGDTYCS